MFSQEDNPFTSPILKVRKTTKGKGRNFRTTKEIGRASCRERV